MCTRKGHAPRCHGHGWQWTRCPHNHPMRHLPLSPAKFTCFWAVWFYYNYHHTEPYDFITITIILSRMILLQLPSYCAVYYLWLTDCHFYHHAVYHLPSPATNYYLPDPDRAVAFPIYSTITTRDHLMNHLVLWSPYHAITGVPQILTSANRTCCYNDQHCIHIYDYMLPSMLSTNTTLRILKMLFWSVLVRPSHAAPT